MSSLITTAFANPRTRRVVVPALVILLVFTFLYYSSDSPYTEHVREQISLAQWKSPSLDKDTSSGPVQLDPICSKLPGAQDVLLVMKTGSSVIEKRLPIHLKTTFRCSPDFLVFSDMAQNFHGIPIHDSLEGIDQFVDMSDPNLKYYEHLKKSSERKQNSFLGGWGQEEEQPDFKESDAAWELDKYKNVPILRKSYAMFPEKKWYIFMDADTAIMWSNILVWLGQLDHAKPFYTGSPTWIGDVQFAHGGSGYIVSQAAAKILAEEDEDQARDHISYARNQCCGDMVLSHAFHDHSIALNASWPAIQGGSPNRLEYDWDKWCYAAMTYHHVNAEQIKELWDLERQTQGAKNLTYGDIFTETIFSHLPAEANEWDNESGDILYPPNRSQEDFESDPSASWKPNDAELAAVSSFEGCRDACKLEQHCFQFCFKPNVTGEGQPTDTWNGQCGLRKKMSYGQKSTEGLDGGRGAVRSGWDLERIELWTRKHKCTDGAVFMTWWGDDGALEP